MLCFQLTMPGNNAWNGKWTGENNKYYKFERLSPKREEELDGKYLTYSFGDGWTAGIEIEKIDSKEKRKREKQSAGFCGYEWMIKSILLHGEIKTSKYV